MLIPRGLPLPPSPTPRFPDVTISRRFLLADYSDQVDEEVVATCKRGDLESGQAAATYVSAPRRPRKIQICPEIHRSVTSRHLGPQLLGS